MIECVLDFFDRPFEFFDEVNDDARVEGAAPPIRRIGGVADEMALPIESIAINYITISITYEFAVLF